MTESLSFDAFRSGSLPVTLAVFVIGLPVVSTSSVNLTATVALEPDVSEPTVQVRPLPS